MSRATLDLLCADLPGAEAPQGGEATAWSVGGEAFAVVSASGVAVRAADGEAAMLVAAGMARPAPGLPSPWVLLPVESPESDLRSRVVASYEIARDLLPEEVQATLDRTSG